MSFRNFGLLERREGVKGGRVCMADTGVPVEIVVDLFVAGESAETVAREFGVKESYVQAALRLALVATYTQRGLPITVQRKMEDLIPLMRQPSMRTDDETR